MTTPSSHEVTQLLVAWRDGDQAALKRLTPLVYRELAPSRVEAGGTR
jgi:hypothetical protein